jgi:hypothetical protein
MPGTTAMTNTRDSPHPDLLDSRLQAMCDAVAAGVRRSLARATVADLARKSK